MVNCTKCGAEVDHPTKTWKIKQTPVALYECPSCKTKWRTKFIEEPTAPKIAQLTFSKPAKDITPPVTSSELSRRAMIILSEPAKDITPPVIKEADKEAPVIEAITTMVENHIAEPNKPASIFEGLKAFLSSLFF